MSLVVMSNTSSMSLTRIWFISTTDGLFLQMRIFCSFCKVSHVDEVGRMSVDEDQMLGVKASAAEDPTQAETVSETVSGTETQAETVSETVSGTETQAETVSETVSGAETPVEASSKMVCGAEAPAQPKTFL